MQLVAKRREHPSDAKGIEVLRQAFVSAWYAILPPVVWLAFFISVPISSFAFLAVRECDCFWLYDDVGTINGTICFSTADYSLRCPASAGSYTYKQNATHLPDSLSPEERALYEETIVAANVGIYMYAFGVPAIFAGLLLYCRRNIEGPLDPTRLSQALSFLYSEYRDGFYAWELLVTLQKQVCLDPRLAGPALFWADSCLHVLLDVHRPLSAFSHSQHFRPASQSNCS